MNEREQLRHDLEIQVLIHIHLRVEEIVEVPEVRRLLEKLYPQKRATLLFYRAKVASIVRAKLNADGTREYASVTQAELPIEVEPEPIVREERVYVEASLATDSQRISALDQRRKQILGILKRDPHLPEDARLEMYAAIDNGYTRVIGDIQQDAA